MSDVCLVVLSTSERVVMLNNLLRSIERHPEMSRYDVRVHLQDWTGEAAGAVQPTAHTRVHVTGPRVGCHAARVALLRHLHEEGEHYRAYVNLDDDIEVTAHTTYAPAIAQSYLPGVGFVLTNWARSAGVYRLKVPKIRHEFVPQAMVYQGGGMAYDADLAALMRDLPLTPARYDDIWPLTSYLSGRRNYRYLGSLAMHRTLGRGGMHAYMRAEPRPLLCWDWIDYEHIPGAAVGVEYRIPADSHLRPAARAEHRRSREAAGWTLNSQENA